jgi:hypothetical protein
MFNRFVQFGSVGATYDSSLDDNIPGKPGDILELQDAEGSRCWYVLGLNDTGAPLPAYQAVQYDGTDLVNVEAASASCHVSRMHSIPQLAVPDGHYFYGLRKGKGLGKSNAAITAKALFGTLGAAGKIDDDGALANSLLWGQALEAATGANEDIAIRLDLPI